MKNSLFLIFFIFNCIIVSVFADQFYALGVFSENYFNDEIQGELLLIDSEAGTVTSTGTTVPYRTDLYCSNIFASYYGTDNLFVLASQSLFVYDAQSAILMSNSTYDMQHYLPHGYYIESSTWDPSTNTIAGILATNSKYYTISIDPSTAYITLGFPITQITSIESCVGDLDYNQGIYYISTTGFDITAIGTNSGSIIGQYYFSNYVYYIMDIIVSDVDQNVFVISTDYNQNSYLWSCQLDTYSNTFSCYMSSYYPSGYIAYYAGSAYFDAFSSILYSLHFNSYAGDWAIFGIDTTDMILEVDTPLEDLSANYPYGVFSMDWEASSSIEKKKSAQKQK